MTPAQFIAKWQATTLSERSACQPHFFDLCATELRKRTLTNLYNQRPTWLDLAHQKLDAAVCAAYGWPTSLTDDELLARLLALNLERSRVMPRSGGIS